MTSKAKDCARRRKSDSTGKEKMQNGGDTHGDLRNRRLVQGEMSGTSAMLKELMRLDSIAATAVHQGTWPVSVPSVGKRAKAKARDPKEHATTSETWGNGATRQPEEEK